MHQHGVDRGVEFVWHIMDVLSTPSDSEGDTLSSMDDDGEGSSGEESEDDEGSTSSSASSTSFASSSSSFTSTASSSSDSSQQSSASSDDEHGKLGSSHFLRVKRLCIQIRKSLFLTAIS